MNTEKAKLACDGIMPVDDMLHVNPLSRAGVILPGRMRIDLETGWTPLRTKTCRQRMNLRPCQMIVAKRSLATVLGESDAVFASLTASAGQAFFMSEEVWGGRDCPLPRAYRSPSMLYPQTDGTRANRGGLSIRSRTCGQWTDMDRT